MISRTILIGASMAAIGLATEALAGANDYTFEAVKPEPANAHGDALSKQTQLFLLAGELKVGS